MSAPAALFAREIEAEYPAPDESCTKALLADAALRVLNNQSRSAVRQHRATECLKHDDLKFESVTHLNAPSAKRHKTEELGVTTASTGRTPQERNDRITKDHTAEVVSFALKAWGREKSAPIARVQQIAAVDRKTAEAWWHGKNPPQPHHLFTLARHIPELKAEVRRLLGLEQDHHESFQREAIALLQRYVR